MRKQFLFPEMQPDIFFDFFLMSLCFSYIVAEERFITFIICGTKWAKRLKLCFYVYMHSCKMFWNFVSLPFWNEKAILIHNDGVNTRAFTK